MAFKLPPIPIVIAAVCLVLALIFQIVGIAGSGWLVNDGIGYGLFRYCVFLDATVCDSTDIDQSPWNEGWLKAVKAFSILGLIAVLGAVALGVIHFFTETGLQTLVAAILSGVAACCMLIEFAVYAGEMPVPGESSYGYGFILTIIACIASGAAAALFFVAKSSATSAI